ncbi:MAG: hypothetical protein ABR986_05065 [Methanomassiliicoccales archaeon]|jgi:hypothetical protein
MDKKFKVIGILLIASIAVSSIVVVVGLDYNTWVMGWNTGLVPRTDNHNFYDNFDLKTSMGTNVRYEASVQDGYLLNVYLMTEENFHRLEANESFSYISQGSTTNVSHFTAEVMLDGSVSDYRVVFIQSDSKPYVMHLNATFVQSHYPIGLQPLLRAGLCVGPFTVLFLTFLAIFSKVNDKRGTERTPTDNRGFGGPALMALLASLIVMACLFLILLVPWTVRAAGG